MAISKFSVLKPLLEKLVILRNENGVFANRGIVGVFCRDPYNELTPLAAAICCNLAELFVGHEFISHFGIELNEKDNHFPEKKRITISHSGLKSLISTGEEFLKILPQE